MTDSSLSRMKVHFLLLLPMSVPLNEYFEMIVSLFHIRCSRYHKSILSKPIGLPYRQTPTSIMH